MTATATSGREGEGQGEAGELGDGRMEEGRESFIFFSSFSFFVFYSCVERCKKNGSLQNRCLLDFRWILERRLLKFQNFKAPMGSPGRHFAPRGAPRPPRASRESDFFRAHAILGCLEASQGACQDPIGHPREQIRGPILPIKTIQNNRSRKNR